MAGRVPVNERVAAAERSRQDTARTLMLREWIRYHDTASSSPGLIILPPGSRATTWNVRPGGPTVGPVIAPPEGPYVLPVDPRKDPARGRPAPAQQPGRLHWLDAALIVTFLVLAVAVWVLVTS